MSFPNSIAGSLHRFRSKASPEARSIEEIEPILINIRPLIHGHSAVRVPRLLAPSVIIVDLRSSFKTRLLTVERHVLFEVRPAKLDANLAAIGAVGAKVYHGVHDCDGSSDLRAPLGRK